MILADDNIMALTAEKIVQLPSELLQNIACVAKLERLLSFSFRQRHVPTWFVVIERCIDPT
jgi:hypothetical protein